MSEREHPTESSLIRVHGLVREYQANGNRVHALRGIDLDVRRGERLAIVGPSGSGKSTLLFILGLLLEPTAGVYFMDGCDVLRLNRKEQAAYRRKSVGFVFQACNLVEPATVYENLEFPLIYAGMPASQRPALIERIAATVEMTHRLHHPANRLSGGEQQRVAIARAMVNRPKLILADEPTGQLDRHNGDRVMEYFEQMVAGGETALITVTHDPEVARRCTRVCRLVDGRLSPE